MANRNADTSRPAIEGGTPVRPRPLPFYRASIDASDVESVVDTLRSGWLTVGPKTIQLEEKIAEYVGAKHVVSVSSCSEAMFLALKAMGIGEGDEVITSANTFASTVHAIIHCGGTPVLADIEAETFGPDPAHVESLITERTRAVLPVHFGGQACRIEEIIDLARRRGLLVLEDAAHAFGAAVGSRRIGTFGDATAFSFYATKNLTTAEGGAIVTNDSSRVEELRRLSFHGMSRDSWSRYSDRGSWYYEVASVGYKCNMSDLQASLGLSQFARIDWLLGRRREVAGELIARLADSPYVEVPIEREGNHHTWHLFVIRLHLDRLKIDRDRFIAALTEENIGNSVHFIPVHHHPFFAKYGVSREMFPACEDYFSRCISLPLYPDMTTQDVDDVVAAVSRIAEFYAAD